MVVEVRIVDDDWVGVCRTVNRVAQHVIDPLPAGSDPSDAFRIFVVFSGLAGAWKAIKELDGRLFGGRHLVSTW